MPPDTPPPDALPPSAALVIVGNEVLSAKVQDENTPFLLDRFRKLGVPVTRIFVAPDERLALIECYRLAMAAARWVISTGGVGPTHDDITMGAVAEALGRPLVVHPELEQLIRDYFGEDCNEFHLKMARVPEGATLTWGDGLKLPVLRVDDLFVLPGTPGLVRSKFLGIEEMFRQQPFVLRRLHLDTDEGLVAQLLTDAEEAFPEVSVGSYPVFGSFDHKVEVTVEGKDAAQVEAVVERLRTTLPEGVLLGVH